MQSASRGFEESCCLLLRLRIFKKDTAMTCFAVHKKAIPSLETSVNPSRPHSVVISEDFRIFAAKGLILFPCIEEVYS